MPPSNERKISRWIARRLLFFDNETKAYEGQRALIQLDSEGSISVYGYAVVAKNADVTSMIKQGDDDAAPLGVWSIRQGCREGNAIPKMRISA
jgi:hypothetical protein